MPLVVANTKRIFFAHVPKAGGSSVEDYLERRFGGPLSLRMKAPREHYPQSGMIISATHLSAADLDHVLPHDTDHMFTVVRNPLSRMQSQFRFQDGVSKTRKLDFATWMRVMLAAATIDSRVYRNHIRPQSDLIREGTEVFKLEDRFTDMITWLDEVTGTTAPEVEMGHLLKKKHEPIPVTRQDAELIGQFYAADYDRFGYERPDPASLPNKPFPAYKRPIVATLARLIVAKQRRVWTR